MFPPLPFLAVPTFQFFGSPPGFDIRRGVRCGLGPACASDDRLFDQPALGVDLGPGAAEDRGMIPGDFKVERLFPGDDGRNVVERPPELRPCYAAVGEALGSVDSDEPIDAESEVDFFSGVDGLVSSNSRSRYGRIPAHVSST